jgi:exodeoxyribonuclease VII small subunit
MSENSIEKLSYEQAFAELEKIAAQLESESHPLQESIALYERGQLLAKHCSSLLEKAQLRIQRIDPNGLGQKGE